MLHQVSVNKIKSSFRSGDTAANSPSLLPMLCAVLLSESGPGGFVLLLLRLRPVAPVPSLRSLFSLRLCGLLSLSPSRPAGGWKGLAPCPMSLLLLFLSRLSFLAFSAHHHPFQGFCLVLFCEFFSVLSFCHFCQLHGLTPVKMTYMRTSVIQQFY
jgi:hypothetical protein